MGGGSSTPANTTQKTTQDPWEEQKPFLMHGFQQAYNLYQTQDNPQYYPGSTYAGMSGDTLNSAKALTANAMGAGQTAIGQLADTAGGSYLQGNPYFQQMVDQSIQAARPSVDAAFASTGRLGSGAHANAFADAATRAATSLGYQNYATERQNQMAAAQALPGVIGGVGQAGIMGGQVQDQNQQSALNANVERWNYEQNLPTNKLANYMQMIQGNYGGTNTSTLPVYSNPGMQYAGAAIGGLGALGSLGQGIGAMGWSDIRLKENIRKVGELDNGLGVYAYNYIDDDRQQIGLLAQEVQQSKPDAVGNFGGLLAVDYGKAVQ